MKQKLKAVFRDFAETTTAHAPPKILTHSHILSKLFWGLLFVVGLGVFVYFSQELISTYAEYERTTDIELKFNLLDFPAVTVCNQNQFRKDRLPRDLSDLLTDFLLSKRADMFGGKDKFEQFMNSKIAGNQAKQNGAESEEEKEESGTPAANIPTVAASTTKSPTPSAGGTGAPAGKRRRRRAIETLSEENMKIIEDMYGFYNKPTIEDMENMTWFAEVGQTSSDKNIILNLTQVISEYDQSELIRAGHDIEEMLQECMFLGITCGPEDFYHFYDMKYGNCYTFNSGMNGEVTKVSNPGASFGLSLTMFINQDEYMPVLTQEAGLRVMLHRQGQVPILEEDGFDIAPGTKSSIAVKYVEISRLPGYGGDCVNVLNRTRTHKFYPGNYTQKACLKTCLQMGIMDNCSCATPKYRYPEGVSMCGPADNACVEEVETSLLENDYCSDQCPTPCWESQYQYVISASQWPSNSYMPYLKESLDERGNTMKGVMEGDTRTGMSQQFLKMIVYYDKLNYNKYTERLSMTLKDLIGALGGHLGLWIGMSVISFVEFFELIMLVFKWCFCKTRNKTSSLTDLNTDDRAEKVQTPVYQLKDNWAKDT